MKTPWDDMPVNAEKLYFVGGEKDSPGTCYGGKFGPLACYSTPRNNNITLVAFINHSDASKYCEIRSEQTGGIRWSPIQVNEAEMIEVATELAVIPRKGFVVPNILKLVAIADDDKLEGTDYEIRINTTNVIKEGNSRIKSEKPI